MLKECKIAGVCDTKRKGERVGNGEKGRRGGEVQTENDTPKQRI